MEVNSPSMAYEKIKENGTLLVRDALKGEAVFFVKTAENEIKIRVRWSKILLIHPGEGESRSSTGLLIHNKFTHSALVAMLRGFFIP